MKTTSMLYSLIISYNALMCGYLNFFFVLLNIFLVLCGIRIIFIGLSVLQIMRPHLEEIKQQMEDRVWVFIVFSHINEAGWLILFINESLNLVQSFFYFFRLWIPQLWRKVKSE